MATKFRIETPESITDIHANMVFEEIKKEISNDLEGNELEFNLALGKESYDIILEENELPNEIALIKFNLVVDDLSQAIVQERVGAVLYGLKKLNLTDKNYVYLFKPSNENKFECMNHPDLDITSHNECLSEIMRKFENNEIVYVDEIHEYIVENNILVFAKQKTIDGIKLNEISVRLDETSNPSRGVDIDPRMSNQQLLEIIKELHNEVKN